MLEDAANRRFVTLTYGGNVTWKHNLKVELIGGAAAVMFVLIGGGELRPGSSCKYLLKLFCIHHLELESYG